MVGEPPFISLPWTLPTLEEHLFICHLPLTAPTSEFPFLAVLLGMDSEPPMTTTLKQGGSSDCEIMMVFQGQHYASLRTHITL